MISVVRRKRQPGGTTTAWQQPQPVPGEGAVTDEPVRKKSPDKRAAKPDKPGAGRTSPLGRKVESPERIKTPGPSGQRGSTQDQKQHTNK